MGPADGNQNLRRRTLYIMEILISRTNMKKIIIPVLAALMLMPAGAVLCCAAEPQENVKTDSRKAKKKKDIRTIVLSADVHCHSCSNKIMENIAFEKGIKDLKVSVPEKKITVKYDASKTNEEAILEAFRKIGYPAVVVERK